MSTQEQPSSIGHVADGISRRLRLAFSRKPATSDDPIRPHVPPLAPQVEFMAFAEDCILSGYARLDAGRLSDLLNGHDEYELVDVSAMELETGHLRETRMIVVARDELLIVHATGPRGVPGRRIRTRQHPVALALGPYVIRGYLHCLPGTDPIASFHRRKPMVALTDAWVEYLVDGVQQRRRMSSVVVNRRRVDWIVQVKDEAVELPEIPVPVHDGVQAKDLTGHVRARAS